MSFKVSLLLMAALTFASTWHAGPLASSAISVNIQNAETPGPSAPSAGANSMIIRLEQRKDEKILKMRPDHVFDSGDVVRFILTSGFDGYLYVIEQGSSGNYAPLFPAAGSKVDNRIHKGNDSLVPSIEDGWFQIDGPAGFDVVYFLVSSTPISISTDEGAKEKKQQDNLPPQPNSLRPRCNDAIFQARGECIDESAGPASLARDVPLPPQFSMATRYASRDIVFVAGDDEKSVEVSAPSATPVVYIFRLAHH